MKMMTQSALSAKMVTLWMMRDNAKSVQEDAHFVKILTFASNAKKETIMILMKTNVKDVKMAVNNVLLTNVKCIKKELLFSMAKLLSAPRVVLTVIALIRLSAMSVRTDFGSILIKVARNAHLAVRIVKMPAPVLNVAKELLKLEGNALFVLTVVLNARTPIPVPSATVALSFRRIILVQNLVRIVAVLSARKMTKLFAKNVGLDMLLCTMANVQNVFKIVAEHVIH